MSYGIQVTIHEVSAIVKYTNTHDRKQALYALKDYTGAISINTIPLKGITVYEGLSRDCRSLSMSHFYSFNPYGPYYEWFLFLDELKKRQDNK